MKFTQADLLAMSTDELSELNSMVVATIKAKRTLEGASIKADLHEGQEVKVNHKDHLNDIFVIKKVNKTRASIRLKNGTKGYTVPFSMILTKW